MQQQQQRARGDVEQSSSDSVVFNEGAGPVEVFTNGTYQTIGPVWSLTLCPSGCQRSLNKVLLIEKYFFSSG